MRTGEIVGGRFEVGPRAGAGGMGTVYRARDLTDGETVALKVFPALGDIGIRRFDREATALSRVVHPAVVHYLLHGVDGDRPWIAMEWLEGVTLRERLAHGPLPIDEAVAIVRRVSEGVAVAHRLGLVHRDLKPSNVFLPKVGGARVIDFGLARATIGEEDDLTRTGALLGTVGYMAPEQARAPREAGPRADVFGLAAVLYRCVSGERPFRGRDELETLVRTVFDEVPDARTLAPDVPPALAALLLRALARDAEKRPESAAAFAEELAAIELEPGQVTARGGIGAREQRVTCAVIASGPFDARGEELLQNAAAKHGATLGRGRRGERVLTVASEGAATDRAGRAATCAIELRAMLPGCELAIVAKREGETPHTPPPQGRSPLHGSVLHGSAVHGIAVDDVVARLLEGRFEVEETSSGLVLRGERAGTRTLLGRPTPCVGRERELAFLGSLYDECANDGVARVAIVIAPPGIGKSRLRYELLRRIESRGEAQIWIARGDPMRGGSPFGIVSDALRPLFELAPEDDDLTRRRKIGAYVSRVVARGETERVADFLAEILRTPGETDSHAANVQLRAARKSARLMADQVTRAFADFVAAQGARGPLVMVLEDLHWGDSPSIALVDAALRACRDLPLLVIAFARPEIRERHPGLWSDRGATELPLGELGKRPAERLVRAVLGEAAEEQTVARIIEQAGGNAFFLEELIRAVAEGKRSDLPETVVAMAQARLESLEPDARRVLRAAAIFGQSFERSGVSALLAPAEVDQWLEELARRELLQRRGDGPYVFRHAFVREAAYNLLTLEDRALGHRMAAEWLEKQGERDARMLADHLERGGDRARAAVYHRRAAEQALEANDLPLASREAERGIATGAAGDDFVVCARILAEVSSWIGETRAAERWGLEAVARAKPGSAIWCEAVSQAAGAAGRLGSTVRLLALADQMRSARDTAESGRAWLLAAQRLAVQLFLSGCYAAGRALYALVEETAKHHESDLLVAARLAGARAFFTHFEGDPTADRAFNRIAADASERAGDLRNRCVYLMNIGVGSIEIGDWAHAERAIREALSSAERLGLENLAGACHNNLGWAIARAGRLDEGFAEVSEGLRILERHGDKRMIGGTRSHLAFIHWLRGDWQLAEAEALRAVEVLAAAPPLRAQAHALVARARLAMGDLDGALAAAEAARRQLEALGKLDEGEAVVHLTYVEVLRAHADRRGVISAVETARERILTRAASIVDPRLRDAFLQEVPEHAALLGDDVLRMPPT